MNIQDQLIMSSFRFRKIGTTFPDGFNAQLKKMNVSVMEMALMKGISDNTSDSVGNITIADLQNVLFITKAAISQMYGSLEKKGYLVREVDKNNRRKLIVTLTPKGKETLGLMEEKMDLILSQTISRFGEEDTLQLVQLINRFADVIEEMKQQAFSE